MALTKKQKKERRKTVIRLINSGKKQQANEILREEARENIEGKVLIRLDKRTEIYVDKEELEKEGKEAVIEKYRMIYCKIYN